MLLLYIFSTFFKRKKILLKDLVGTNRSFLLAAQVRDNNDARLKLKTKAASEALALVVVVGYFKSRTSKALQAALDKCPYDRYFFLWDRTGKLVVDGY